MKRVLLTAGAALVVLLALFDVDFEPRLVLPHSEQRVDPGQEARYEACVEEYDHEIHAETFARVDNPDVQREILYRRMQEAKAACRETYPERMIEVEVPFDVNLIDLSWRFR